MWSLLNADNLAGVLTAIGALITAVGGLTFWRVWREPSPKPGTPDAMAVALAQNTQASEAMTGQFGENLKLFAATLKATENIERDIDACREHLSAIRDAVNRR